MLGSVGWQRGLLHAVMCSLIRTPFNDEYGKGLTASVVLLQPMTTFVTCTVCNNRWKFRYASTCDTYLAQSSALNHSPTMHKD